MLERAEPAVMIGLIKMTINAIAVVIGLTVVSLVVNVVQYIAWRRHPARKLLNTPSLTPEELKEFKYQFAKHYQPQYTKMVQEWHDRHKND